MHAQFLSPVTLCSPVHCCPPGQVGPRWIHYEAFAEVLVREGGGLEKMVAEELRTEGGLMWKEQDLVVNSQG